MRTYYNISGWLPTALTVDMGPLNTTGAAVNCHSKFLNLTSYRGVISDGPGTYNNFSLTTFLGTDVQISELLYTTDGSPDGFANIEFRVYISPDDPSIADWSVGSRVKLFTPSDFGPNNTLTLLNGKAVTLTSWDRAKAVGTVERTGSVSRYQFTCTGSSCQPVVIADLIIPGYCMSDNGGCYKGTFPGSTCGWYIQPPWGFAVILNITRVDLADGDLLLLDKTKTFNDNATFSSDISPSWFNSLPTSQFANVTSSTFLIGDIGHPILLAFSSHVNSTGARGFEASFQMIPRVRFLADRGNATQLQFALAVLEMQGANMTALAAASGTAIETIFSTGLGVLGPPSEAEKCFTCLWNKDPKLVGAVAPWTPALDADSPTLPVYTLRPPATALGLDQSFEAG
eukprot:CAMPEP_0113673822 /NCGR_PEP_ID=MMETSP0038_2-20120614/7065_1 /TAXON_ID=2898 /ORGANISM="Cryptomonas paramecium" /LENGTH=399 /DNA_ID=CAMNT_0000590311 /DNA_START=590 /DNA_END=1785 /DNA_ORIENTATION=- /assembly_acc=CAM_ASM_000170